MASDPTTKEGRRQIKLATAIRIRNRIRRTRSAQRTCKAHVPVTAIKKRDASVELVCKSCGHNCSLKPPVRARDYSRGLAILGDDCPLSMDNHYKITKIE